MPFDLINIASAGFSIGSAATLLLAYAVLMDVPGKSAYSVSSCAALLIALTLIQLGHLQYFLAGVEPLDTFAYRLGIFVAPSTFYFFGRWAILPNERFKPQQLVHLLPIVPLFVLPQGLALPVLFLFGAGYSLWLGYVVFGLRDQRKQFKFELAYFAVMSAFALGVLALGFALPYLEHVYFYVFYTHAIALAFAIIIAALVSNPNLVGDLYEAARVKYGASTLKDIDVDASLKKLDGLMTQTKLYKNEDLSLASLATEVGLSGHQLSELINTRLGMGFSRYVRECRVKAAQTLLITAPTQSILSISMDTGFRSQSSFYAAFKEVTGQSPGDYRKSRVATPE